MYKYNYFTLSIIMQPPHLCVMVYFHCFRIKSSIRQSGIYYPIFFNVYINDLILKLRSNGTDCYLCFDFVD